MFNFTKEEIIFCVSTFNGVIPTIDIENMWESIRPNILANGEFEDMPETLPDKLSSLTFWQTLELYCKIRSFWDVDGYSIPDTNKRLQEVGLI